jgi:hypothetical protein
MLQDISSHPCDYTLREIVGVARLETRLLQLQAWFPSATTRVDRSLRFEAD